jgi:hypothetical protein
MESISIQKMQEELTFLKKEVNEIKEQMVDVDSILTEDDFKALIEYKKEKTEKKLSSHEKIKKELGL